MSQAKVSEICNQFYTITGIKCRGKFMSMGKSHQPSSLVKNKTQGVYVFLRGENVFKVGKAGPKSNPRWVSHHYSLHTPVPSTFPKSFMNDLDHFKTFFPISIQEDMDHINDKNVRNWIRSNISRIEFTISGKENKNVLNLLEALVLFHLNPIYEGVGS